MKARYDLEPTLRDVYVEGAFDHAIVEEVLRRAGCTRATVYQIDTIDVPADTLRKYGLSDGNKGRVIALCLELEAQMMPPEQVTGLVDRDFDNLLGLTYPCSLLLFTDYSCMEMYFFDLAQMERFCTRFLRKERELASQLLGMLSPVLQDLFFIRATNEDLKLGLTWLDADDQCVARKDRLEFDTETFVQKYLSKGSLLLEKDRFVTRLDALWARADVEIRRQIHGHDFVRLLAKCLHPVMRNASFSDPDVVERALPAWADYESVRQAPMFEKLIQRVSS